VEVGREDANHRSGNDLATGDHFHRWRSRWARGREGENENASDDGNDSVHACLRFHDRQSAEHRASAKPPVLPTIVIVAPGRRGESWGICTAHGSLRPPRDEGRGLDGLALVDRNGVGLLRDDVA
jgi:hypothetical protein